MILQGRQVQGYRFYVMKEMNYFQCGHRDRGMRVARTFEHEIDFLCKIKKPFIHTFVISPFH